MKKCMKGKMAAGAAAAAALAAVLSGCGTGEDNGKVTIEMIQSKPETAVYFDKVEEEFNATHDDIELIIDSPNDANTILKTRFIREDYPDIIAIGGDINYSNYLDSGMLMDISDYEGLNSIKQAYLDIDKELEFVPMDGIYAVPYVANAAGILYNKDIFDEHGWTIPTTWDELTVLCKEIQDAGLQPFYFGFKDSWNCLAPWNAISVDLAPSDVCAQVNRGETTFTDNYREVAEKTKALLEFAQDDPFAYSYNDACTAFARGESVMFPIGSYAVPQIQSVNPDIKIGTGYMNSFTDAAKGKEVGLALYNAGSDIVFQAAGGAGLGVLDAAKEAGMHAIGTDSDQSEMFSSDTEKANAIYTSIMKRVDLSIDKAIGKYVDGDLEFGTVDVYGVADGCIELTDNSWYQENVPQEVRDAVEAAKQDIIGGSVTPSSAHDMDDEEVQKMKDEVQP